MQLNPVDRSPLLDQWKLDELRYSFVWEDFTRLEAAIDTQGLNARRILSIGSSGENAISLLNHCAEEVIAIDLSHAQIHLLELKKVAIQHLDFNKFTFFFGYCDEGQSRSHLYGALSKHLPTETKEYWDVHQHLIEQGIVFHGRLEKYFAKFRNHVIPKIWEKDVFEKMVTSMEVQSQLQAWSQGDLDLLQKVAKEFFSQDSLSQGGRHKSQFQYVKETDTGSLFLKRFLQLMHTSPVSTNPYLFQFLTGKMNFENNSIPLLNPNTYPTIQNNIEKLKITHQDLESFLATNEAAFDFMNLSDIFEYLSEAQSAKLFQAIAKNLSPEGLLCYWTLLVDRRPNKNMTLLKELSKEIFKHDKTWFYSNFYISRRNKA